MKTILFVTGLLFAAACGGKSKGDAGDPCKDPCKDKQVAAMTCDGMAERVEDSMTAEGTPADIATGMRDVFGEQCASMSWSQEAIDCIAAAKNEEEGNACKTAMTDEQWYSLDTALDEMEMGMVGDGGEAGME